MTTPNPLAIGYVLPFLAYLSDFKDSINTIPQQMCAIKAELWAFARSILAFFRWLGDAEEAIRVEVKRIVLRQFRSAIRSMLEYLEDPPGEHTSRHNFLALVKCHPYSGRYIDFSVPRSSQDVK